MYVDILSSALDEWVSDLSGTMLVEYALMCRAEMLTASTRRNGSAYSALAAEIAYDRALITLCTERGIDAHATSFAYPAVERRRIEGLLAQMGVDLVAMARRQLISAVPQLTSGDKEEGRSTAIEPVAPQQRAKDLDLQSAALDIAEEDSVDDIGPNCEL